MAMLIADPRCGSDLDLYFWNDVWKCASVGASDHYGMKIEISRVFEAHASSEVERLGYDR
jgi:hypothetical protein